ncbi:NAD(P)/FAD-dependent oxidoreductase [Sulfurimonas sp.]|uniref:phytoene desaturase family protein n=1 Tax=Sulfurimonas sp. TaxID=2022749 RepID=UPI002AB0492E|nr:NAD(P)/FAD-dependent oxidoreductase [Sulfurimonas sp.]
MKFDTIIIGSGAGGLSAAICLAKAGQKVLVLEQHYVAGGWCHSFKLHGSKFTPGIHYIGLLEDGESTSELYKGLGIANDLTFFKMNKDAYEHCYIGNERFDIPANFEEFKNALIKRFPHEKKSITRYLNTIKDVSRELQLIPKMNGFLDAITIPWRTRHMGKYGLFSLKRVIDWHVKDPLLQIILNVQCGDHGLPPALASFPLHAAVMEHYFSGGYYPKGGGASIVDAMIKKINLHGSQVRVKQMVKSIIIQGEEDKKAVGVELQSGEKIYANNILSNADPHKTYVDLVGQNHLSKKLNEKLDSTKYSCTSIMLFLTVNLDVREAGLDSGNIWVMPNKDMDEVYSDMMSVDILSTDKFKGLFVSCTTLKDPDSFDGKHHVLEVITYINYESFKEFEGEKKKRSKEYLVFKEKLMSKMINSLEEVIPNISKHIVHKDLATPITNNHYINSSKGNVYGTAKNLKQIGPFAFRPKSEIQNLYLCGASILSHGVAGASHSGVHTAATILGCRFEELLKHDNTQKLKIIDAQKK